MSFSEQSDLDHEDEEEGQIAAITTAWAHMFGEEKRTVSQFVEALLEGHKSAESGRRARADAAMSAVAGLRGLPVSKLEGRQYGEVFRILKDRPMLLEGVDCRFRTVGLRSKVAVWQLDGAAELCAKLDREF